MMATTALILVLGFSATALAAVFLHRYLVARDVARAVGFEIASMRWQAAAMAAEIARRYRAGEAFDTEFFRVWRLSAPQVFPAVGGQLGLLWGGIDRIGYFHAQLAAARERLALAEVDGGFRPSPYRILSALVRAWGDVTPWVEPYLGVMTRDTPDLSDASRLLDELETAAREPIALAYVWADSCAHWDGNMGDKPAPIQG